MKPEELEHQLGILLNAPLHTHASELAGIVLRFLKEHNFVQLNENQLLTDEEIFKILFGVSWEIFPKQTYAKNIKTYIGDSYTLVAKAQLAKDQIEIDKRDKMIKNLQGICNDWERLNKESIERIFTVLDEAFGSFLNKKVVYQNLKLDFIKEK